MSLGQLSILVDNRTYNMKMERYAPNDRSDIDKEENMVNEINYENPFV